MTTGYEVCRAQIKQKVIDVLQSGESVEDEVVFSCIEETAREFAGYRLLRPADKARMLKEIFNSIRKLDLLEELLEQQDITEIMLNSYDRIFIERNGKIEQYDGQFESEERYMDIIQQIVSRCNRVVNGANPIVDARLEDGSRVNVVLSPIALQGTCMTIRHFQDKPLQMEDLIGKGSITGECAEFLKKLVVAKYNIFVSGGTGAGKTSFLNILSGYIPEEERIITLEDSAELRLQNTPNLVRLETRNGNEQDCRAITMRDLIKTSLRMRPNRIIVGEVRGEECVDMLQAMNTGQEGSMSTGHSNSGRDMIARLETMCLMAQELPLAAIRRQLLSIDIIVHLGRLRDHSRKVLEVWELTGLEQGEVQMKLLYVFKEEGEEDGKVLGKLQKVGELTKTGKLKMAGFAVSS
ncbi:MAG: CpaF family protein [Lachnospiraceae bacterium]|nr:CpaF family protein [Lachnospiraceae bacterium]